MENEPEIKEVFTIEDCEKAYEDGYVAVINDGKFLGFVKEKTL